MNFSSNDPRLTSYLLGELSPGETLIVEDALENDPALREELEKILKTQQAIGTRLLAPEEKLHAAQREHILQIAKALSRTKKIIPIAPRPETPAYLMPLAVAAILVFGFLLFLKLAPRTAPAVKVAQSSQPVELPAPVSPKIEISLPVEMEKPITLETRSALAKESPTLKLPIHVATASYARVTQSIQDARALPSPETVRLEEIVNHFSYRFAGVTSIARKANPNWHPDTRDTGASAYSATLSSELIACPWKPSSTLLLISLRGNGKTPIEAKLSYQANPDCVASYRLLGFSPLAGQEPAALASTLGRDETTTLVLEIESLNSGTELGLLQWSTDGKLAPAIPLTRKADADPSNDARFAALVCTYSQWLAGEQSSLVDADLVAALARETASTTLAEDREVFLSLIDQSLHLAERK